MRAEIDTTETLWGGAIEAANEARRILVVPFGQQLTPRLPSGKTAAFHSTRLPVSLGQPLTLDGRGPAPLDA